MQTPSRLRFRLRSALHSWDALVRSIPDMRSDYQRFDPAAHYGRLRPLIIAGGVDSTAIALVRVSTELAIGIMSITSLSVMSCIRHQSIYDL